VNWNFTYGVNTGTSNHRRHLDTYHREAWVKILAAQGLPNLLPSAKNSQEANTNSNIDGDSQQGLEFTLEAFYDQLVRWIVSDDQVCSLHLIMA
jgi:hypothetical protein